MGELEDRLERLAEHRAAQVPPFSMPPTDELAVRRDGGRRDRLVVAIAACLVIALVIGGLLLFSRNSDGPTVETPVGTLHSTAVRRLHGQGLREQLAQGTVSLIDDGDGCGVGPHHRRSASAGWANDRYQSRWQAAYVTTRDLDGTGSVITTATDTVVATITLGRNRSA